MLGKEVIMRELTVLDLDAETPDQIFDVMGKRFEELGYVNERYIPSIKKRESMYPTALPTEPYPIAIPHTEADAIVKPFIAPVRLKNTISWGDMLQILMHNFQRGDWVEMLFAATTEDEFYDAVMDMEWWHD